MELTTIDKFTGEYIIRTGIQPEDLDEQKLLVFAVSSAEKLQTTGKHRIYKVDILPVTNYNAVRPVDFDKIIELAYRGPGNMKPAMSRPAYRDEIVSWTNNKFSECQIKVEIDCPNCYHPRDVCTCKRDEGILIRVDDNYNWLNANAERGYWNMPTYRGAFGLNKFGGRTCSYHPEFTLARPSQHKFFGTDYHVRGCLNLDRRLLGDYPIEYRLEPHVPHIRINVEEGELLIAYKAIPTDDKGFPMVPNDTDLFEAIFWDVEHKMLYSMVRRRPDYLNLAMNAKKMADRHMRLAWEKMDAISPLEWNSIVRNMFKKLPYRNVTTQARRVQADRFDHIVRSFH